MDTGLKYQELISAVINMTVIHVTSFDIYNSRHQTYCSRHSLTRLPTVKTSFTTENSLKSSETTLVSPGWQW